MRACTRTQFSETGSCYALKASLEWPPCLAYILPLKANQFLPFLRLFVEKNNPNYTTNVKLALAQGGAHWDPISTCALVLSEYHTCKMSVYTQQNHSSSYRGDCSWRGRRHFYSMCATFLSLLPPASAVLTEKSLFYACCLHSLNALLSQRMVCWSSRHHPDPVSYPL